MDNIKIEKRTSEEMVCWTVPARGAAPNTLIENPSNLTLLITVDGKKKISSQASFTLLSLLNPGKNTKLFGGKKPYENVEIVAIDQKSEFYAEWGLAGNNAMDYRDVENANVNCQVVAFGEYHYKIEDYFSFVNAITMKDGEISRNDVREYLRGETTGLIKSQLSAGLAQYGLLGCQAKLTYFNEEIKRQINKNLESKGMTVYSFAINNMTYDPSHKQNIKIIDELKIDTIKNKLENDMLRDDIDVDKAQSEVDNSVRKSQSEAIARVNSSVPNNFANTDGAHKPTIVCSRCGTENEDARFCKKCGEKLGN